MTIMTTGDWEDFSTGWTKVSGVEQAEDCGGDENETRLARDALAQLTADVGVMLIWGDGDL
jgi:hypothetical protein